MKKETHIVLVGCGQWGVNILRDLKSLGCEVTVVVRSPESIKLAESQKADTIVKSIIGIKNVDGFVVAAPTSKHFEVLEAICTTYKNQPIFCEKPLADSYTDAKKLQKYADRIFVMDKWRYHPGVLKIVEIVKKQTLGKVIGIKYTRTSWGTTHHDVDSIWTLTPHDLSMTLEILGKIPKPMFARGEYVNNKLVGMVALLGKSPWVSIDTSIRHHDYTRAIRVQCEKGIIAMIDGWSDSIILIKNDDFQLKDPKAQKVRVSKSLPLFEELTTFINYIKTGKNPPKSSYLEALETVRVIDELHGMCSKDR